MYIADLLCIPTEDTVLHNNIIMVSSYACIWKIIKSLHDTNKCLKIYNYEIETVVSSIFFTPLSLQITVRIVSCYPKSSS